MDLRLQQLVILLGMVILLPLQAMATEDWTYEPGSEAKKIYVTRKETASCASIELFAKRNDVASIYNAIRDAGLFGDGDCRKYINANENYLNQQPELKGIVAFFGLMLGDKRQLDVLVRIFDREAKKVGDHWVIELFGYLEDWDVSGRRLVRHAQYSDGAGSELLCSALMWRRFLYGEATFNKNWYRLGKEENVDPKRLSHFYNTCASY